MLGVLILVLSAASGGLAVTAQFTESSVTSDVTVQIDRQFVVPQFESINQTDIRESKGSQSLLRTQNGTTLRVIEENVTADSITVTVPIENNGTNRRTTRLSVESSTTPFRIDTETISQSFANNSTFARTVNHTLASDTDAFVELPSTVGDEPRAVNVTVSYNKTPASPLTAAFRLSPTEGRIDVQPDSQLNGSGGSGSGGGGGTSNDLLAPGSQTVVTGGLTLVNENGTDSDTVVVTDNVDVLVLPSGAYGDWLTDPRAAALTDWVRQGGRLISMGAATDALTDHEAYSLAQQEASRPDASEEPSLSAYGSQTRERLAGATPGSIHRVRLDDSHPLGFGIEPPYFTLKRNDDAFAYLKNGHTVGALQAPAPVSGFMGHEAQETIDDTFLFGTQPLGNGRVTYFVDNPLFRGFWYNGQVLFANAVFFVGNG